jgi:DNA polymerase (family 10)
MNKTDTLINNLSEVPGIGNDTAMFLIKQGVTKKSDLKKTKYYKLLSVTSKMYIKYKIEKEFDRKTAEAIINVLPYYLIPVGSYRREQRVIKDMDFLTTIPICLLHNDLKICSRNVDFIEIYKCGSHYLSLILGLNRKNYHIDIFRTTLHDMPYALFHWTGSKNFNIRTRAHAKRQGYKLNQHGLFKLSNGKKIRANTEKDLFKILGITYKKPSDRNE